MKEKSFFKTKEGGLTIAFLAIVAAFAMIMTGLYFSNDILLAAAMLLVTAAMLYSPVKVYIFDRRRKNKE